MPPIKIDHIISFSSEDPVHLASNILSSDTSKKWKCRTPGEKNAVVVLQLEKASVIMGVDIGNEHSAYVEVLVTRSGTNDDYKVLLVASSFMTPIEARQSQNVNKVRMFTREHFSSPECDEKWDRVKIVCTQPFNRHVQYGLSFIILHTSEGKHSVPVQTHIGKFLLRPESPDNLSVGTLFEKRKELNKEEKLTAAAAIRDATSSAYLAQHGSPVCKPKLKTQNVTTISQRESIDNTEKTSKPRNRNELLYSKDEEEPNEKIDKIMEEKKKEVKEKELKLEKEKSEKTPKQNKKADSSSSSKKKENGKVSPRPLDVTINTPSSSKDKNRDSKPGKTDRKRKKDDDGGKRNQTKKPKKNVLTKPFWKLLEDVTLVISGIQNPGRANLRTLAVSMGAKYKPDWDNSCTHLICAYANTPKFHQVKGKGKIIKRKWLEDCHSQRKRLPWRRYALDKSDATKNESEDEICEQTEPDPPVVETVRGDDSEADYSDHKEEASDTEDRIARIEKLQKLEEKENRKDNGVYNTNTDEESPVRKRQERGNSIYSADTDEEGPSERPPTTLPDKLKSLFQDKHFYIDQTFDDEVYNKLHKYIIAYNGKSIEDPTANLDAIITTKQNSSSLKEVNMGTVCLCPDWVWDCHNCQKLVPMDKYIY